MINISYKNLKRQALINLLENYEEELQVYNNKLLSEKRDLPGHFDLKELIKPILTIDEYLNSDATISVEEINCGINQSIEKVAFQIMNEFENLLDKHNITIPDENREGGEDEAHIYGVTYYELEDKIKEILKDNM